MKGLLTKMKTTGNTPVEYSLCLIEKDLKTINHIELNPLIGKNITLNFTGKMQCIACGVKVKKTFNQGYCYNCFNSLPECDSCMMKPERCSFFEGGCRDAEWGKKHCFQDHTVYLANSSGIKIGITRSEQQETRWRDQGARQAIVLGRVKNRLESGIVEMAFKNHLPDKTNWRKMLQNNFSDEDLAYKLKEMLPYWPKKIDRIEPPDANKIYNFEYPVDEYPEKVKSISFDKRNTIGGILKGIKGQYLYFENGVVLNIRKHGGYEIEVEL